MSLGLSLLLVDRYHLRFVETLVRQLDLIGHPPAAFLSNHLLRARYAIRRPECAEVEEIKGDGVPWICLSAPTFELQPSGEGKNASKVSQLAPNVDCFVHTA